MLSERERRTLAEIEQQIVGADPRFRASLRRLESGRRGAPLPDAVIALSVLSGLLCLLLSLPGPAFVALALAAVTLQLRPGRPPWPAGRPGRRRRRR